MQKCVDGQELHCLADIQAMLIPACDPFDTLMEDLTDVRIDMRFKTCDLCITTINLCRDEYECPRLACLTRCTIVLMFKCG